MKAAGKEVWKKRKGLSAVGILVSVFLIIVVTLVGFFEASKPEEDKTVYVYDAYDEEELVYFEAHYMQEYVATWDIYDKGAFYIVYDADLISALVFIKDSDMEQYTPLLQYTYGINDVKPEPVRITGYTSEITSDLYPYIVEEMNYFWNEEVISESVVADWFGPYYIDTSGNKEEFVTYSVIAVIDAILVITLILFMGLHRLYTVRLNEYEAKMSGVIPEYSAALGIFGALLGAILGGVIWCLIGMLGFISGYIGILVYLLTAVGYIMLAGEYKLMGKIVTILFSLLLVPAANIVCAFISYYTYLNNEIAGYISLWEAVKSFGVYFENEELKGGLLEDCVKGYILCAFAFFAAGKYLIHGVADWAKGTGAVAAAIAGAGGSFGNDNSYVGYDTYSNNVINGTDEYDWNARFNTPLNQSSSEQTAAGGQAEQQDSYSWVSDYSDKGEKKELNEDTEAENRTFR